MIITRRNNLYTLLIVLFACNTNGLHAQYNFFNTKIDWNKWELVGSIDNKKVEVAKIKDELLMYLNQKKILDRSYSNFHFLDYDMDGMAEIIYSGDAGTNALRTLIFKPDGKGGYVKVFDKFGFVISMLQPDRIVPPSFILREDPCCGDNNIIYQVYQPINEGENIELQLTTTYCTVRGTSIPIEFCSPAMFELTGNTSLRLTPTTDDSESNTDLNIRGNIIANYSCNAKGYTIAKSTDAKGLIWCFVFMINNDTPSNSILHNGSNDSKHYFSVGWMNSLNMSKHSNMRYKSN